MRFVVSVLAQPRPRACRGNRESVTEVAKAPRVGGVTRAEPARPESGSTGLLREATRQR
jgi:hypothetical protein